MKQCLFCQRTKLTKEHLFPDWIVERFAERTRDRSGHFNASFSHWAGNIERWKQPTIMHKKALMCSRCNNVTIGSVEHVVKPVLVPLIERGRIPQAIERSDQLVIAAWTVVRSMIWDGMGPEQKRYYTQSERESFATASSLSIPPNTHIWLGMYDDAARAVFNIINKVVSEDEGFHIATAAIGNVAIQLVTWKGDGWYLDNAGIRRAGWGDALKQIWPIRRRAIEWPPPRHLDSQGLQALSQRFGGTVGVNI
jgi:hypothetical protein